MRYKSGTRASHYPQLVGQRLLQQTIWIDGLDFGERRAPIALLLVVERDGRGLAIGGGAAAVAAQLSDENCLRRYLRRVVEVLGMYGVVLERSHAAIADHS